MAIATKEVVLKYFSEQEQGQWVCSCGKVRKKGRGWANLLDHIHRDHPDSLEIAKKPNVQVTNFLKKKESNMYSWISWIVEDLLPFSFCEKNNVRRYTNLESICSESLLQGMCRCTSNVEKKIRNILPDQFALGFDGWSDFSTHYLAVFAFFPDNCSELGYKKVLLSFSPLQDESKLTADSHHESIYQVLQLYGRDFSNVSCIIGDNCPVNQLL
jgi:hypothetical protein